MGRSTFITVPADVTNPEELRRFLTRLIEQLDLAFGERSTSPFAKVSSLSEYSTTESIVGQLKEPRNDSDPIYSKVRALANLGITPGSSYNSNEATQITDHIDKLTDKTNELIEALVKAKILL